MNNIKLGGRFRYLIPLTNLPEHVDDTISTMHSFRHVCCGILLISPNGNKRGSYYEF